MDVAGFKSGVVSHLRGELRVPVYRGRPSVGDGGYVMVGRIEGGGWQKEALGGLGSSYRGSLRLPVEVMSAAGFSNPAQAETQTYQVANQIIQALYDFDFQDLVKCEPVEFSELTTWEETPDQSFSLVVVFDCLFYGPPLVGSQLRTP